MISASSRSGSPSSRFAYLSQVKTHTGAATHNTGPVHAGRVRRKSGIPCSQGSSRDTSPIRNGKHHLGDSMSTQSLLELFGTTHLRLYSQLYQIL